MKPITVAKFSCWSAYLSGWRDVGVLSCGRKWLTVVEAGSMQTHKLPLSEARHMRPRNYSPRRLAKRLRRNAKVFGATQPVMEVIRQICR